MEHNYSQIAPLKEVRVLDLTDGPITRIGRLLADLGANITAVNLEGVTGNNTEGPYVDGVAIATAIHRHGIPTTTINAENQAERWESELQQANLLIENTTPGSASEKLLNVAEIRKRHPQLVVLSISDFGRNNPFATWKGTSPVFHALTAELSRTGKPGSAPFIPPGELPYDVAATQALVMTLSVYLDSLRTGVGDRIDFSILEGAAAALDPAYGMAGSAAMGQSLADLPRGRVDLSHQYPIFECADGYVRICVLAKRQWQGMFTWMGSPEEWADPKFDNLHVRFATPELNEAIGAFFRNQTRADIETAGIEYGVPTAALLSLAEALATPQIEARGYLREVEIAPGITAPIPAGIFEIDGHRATALDLIATSTESTNSTPASSFLHRADSPSGRPLEGLRIVDFGIIIVGGDSSRMLGDLGADVIKVENNDFMDGARQSLMTPMAPGFASGHRNKRAVGVNLRSEEGIAFARRLIAEADVVFSNWKPGTAENLGLTFNQLKEINPQIVVVDSSAFGPSGPWSKRLGYGPLVRAASGFTLDWAELAAEGKDSWFNDAITVYPDHVSARISALTALALTIRRVHTGLGGYASASQAEIMMSHAAPATVASVLSSRGGHKIQQNTHDEPWGVFPAKGDDEWVVITVSNQAEWNSLTQLINRNDLAAEAEYSTSEGRRQHREIIYDAVASFTTATEAPLAMKVLQEAGVPAGWMIRGSEMPEWDFYRLRNSFREEQHPWGTSPYTLENVQYHSERTFEPDLRPAPLLGEHTAEVAYEWLAASEEEVSSLLLSGALQSPALPEK